MTAAEQRPSSLSILNMRRVLLLRMVVIAGWTAALLVSLFILKLDLKYWPISAVILLWLIATLWSWRRLATRRELSEQEFFRQIMLDVMMLAILLYLTGGSSNPLTLLFLLSLTVAAAVLSSYYIWMVAAATMVSYSVLLFVHIPFPLVNRTHQNDFGIHIIGMWWGFILSATLIASFVVRMGRTLREQEHMLATVREQKLRDERLVALGALAVGTAHELGTPLATIAVLASEMEREYGDSSPEIGKQLALLKTQVSRCKQALANLSASAGQSQAESGYGMSVEEYLQHILSQWQLMRPTARIQVQLEGVRPAPLVIAEQTLMQAIISILNNAADASPLQIEVTARWDATQLLLEVCDRGEGITPAVTAAVGKRVFSTKACNQGLGLGLYLAYGVISRFEGDIRLFNREGGGACTQLSLPLAQLLINQELRE